MNRNNKTDAAFAKLILSAQEHIVKAILDNDFAMFMKHIKSLHPENSNSIVRSANFNFPNEFSPFSPYKYVSDRLDGLLPMNNVTILHIAAFANSLEIFQYCVDILEIDVDSLSACEYGSIYYAVAGNAIEVFAYITLKTKILPAKYKSNELIKCAVQSHCTQMLRMLLAFCNISNVVDGTLLDIAMGNKDYDTLKILMEIFVSEDNNKTILMHAITKSSNDIDCVKMILKSGADPDVFYNGVSAFYLACEIGQNQIAALVAKYTNIFDIDDKFEKQKRKKCIHYLCRLGDYDVMKYVLQKANIKVNAVDERGYVGPAYLLDRVGDNDFIRIMDLLIEYNFNINKSNSEMIPFIYFFLKKSIKKSLTVLKYLIKNGADLDYVVDECETVKDKLMRIPKFKNVPELINWKKKYFLFFNLFISQNV